MFRFQSVSFLCLVLLLLAELGIETNALAVQT